MLVYMEREGEREVKGNDVLSKGKGNGVKDLYGEVNREWGWKDGSRVRKNKEMVERGKPGREMKGGVECIE